MKKKKKKQTKGNEIQKRGIIESSFSGCIISNLIQSQNNHEVNNQK